MAQDSPKGVSQCASWRLLANIPSMVLMLSTNKLMYLVTTGLECFPADGPLCDATLLRILCVNAVVMAYLRVQYLQSG